MSAFVLGKAHIDALVVAAVCWEPDDLAPLSWFSRELTDEEKAGAYQRGAPWEIGQADYAGVIGADTEVGTGERKEDR